jgi:hypothetical protein
LIFSCLGFAPAVVARAYRPCRLSSPLEIANREFAKTLESRVDHTRVDGIGRRPRRHSRRHIRSKIRKIGREIQVPGLYVFLVHEFFKMIGYKFARFPVRHSRFRVYQLHPSAL